MDKLVFSCFLLGGLTPDPNPSDPCAVVNSYCAAGDTNVACNPPALTGGPACDGKTPEVVNFLVADQNYILTQFNDARNAYAEGTYMNPKANRMFKLQWDASLATQAGHNARSCIIARDACRNTADYANVGQLIVTQLSQTNVVASTTFQQKIDSLLGNNLDISPYFDGRASFSSYSASTGTENEANIMNDRSTKVGCAIMQWTEVDIVSIYLVCDFSGNLIEGQPVYTSAATAAAGCATTDPIYTSLCLT